MAPRASAAWQQLRSAWAPHDREAWAPFLLATTPRVRSMFGWPEPGHPYFGEGTLAMLHELYPAMDLTPYREAMSSGSSPRL
jgi:hypothetical protein